MFKQMKKLIFLAVFAAIAGLAQISDSQAAEEEFSTTVYLDTGAVIKNAKTNFRTSYFITFYEGRDVRITFKSTKSIEFIDLDVSLKGKVKVTMKNGNSAIMDIKWFKDAQVLVENVDPFTGNKQKTSYEIRSAYSPRVIKVEFD